MVNNNNGIRDKIIKAGYKSSLNDPLLIQGELLVKGRHIAQRVPALLILGPAGAGKTFFAKCFARAIGGHFISYQCHYGTGKEELLYDLDIKGVVEKLSGSQGDLASYLRPGILPLAISKAKGSPCVLLLDELEKTRPELDAFLLDFLQTGRIYDPHLGEYKLEDGDQLYVIATSNQDRLLSEPLMRRFRRVYVKYPPPEVEVDIIRETLQKSFPEVNLHQAFLKGLVKIANYLRGRDDIMKPPSTPELINALGDCILLNDPSARAEAIVSWLCAYEEDRAILFEKYPLSWWEGMLDDKNIMVVGG